MKEYVISRKGLKIEDMIYIARNKNVQVSLSSDVLGDVEKSRKFVEKILEKGKPVYGVNTGFGKFKNITIDNKKTCELQENLIRSHAIGTGEPLSEEIVRATILVRAISLSKGYSGIRPIVIKQYLKILNNGIYPYIPSQGSVGCSGDLAPLSHLALVAMGEGEVIENEKCVPAKKILDKYKIKPIKLAAKEGLALNNGTAVMTAIAALAVYDAETLVKTADIAASMSLEVLMGTLTAFHPSIQKIRPYQGQIDSAYNVRKLCAQSEIIKSHKKCDRVQDSYSLRCVPQVHGAIRESLRHVREIVEIELNSVTDNPLIFSDEETTRSGGNFHGEPIALVMDYLGIAMADLGNISERRINKMLDPATNEGLPAFLIPKESAGLSSGYMIAQYTAAALVAENKVLAHPVSVDSIPTSANQEDHVSFGPIASRKSRKIIEHVTTILAIELICGAQAIDFKKPLVPGIGVGTIYQMVRKVIPFLEKDKVFYPELQCVTKQVIRRDFIGTVEKAIGNLR